MNFKICEWCLFKESEHMGKLDHCKKMLKRLKAKIRNQTRCKRSYCNHKKNEHNGEIISNEAIGGGRRALHL